MTTNAELRKQITDTLMQAIEEGAKPWRRPWSLSPNAGRPANVVSKRPYSGINPLLLELHRLKHGLQSRHFGTFRQWSDMGFSIKPRPAHIKKGEWAARVIFYRNVSKEVIDKDTGEVTEQNYPIMRVFHLFSGDQIQGDGAERFQVTEDEHNGIAVPDFAPTEELIEATEADIRFGGERAFFDKTSDYIQMPHKHRFNPPGSFYETILHELSHWSLDQRRMDWKPSNEQHAYAEEELVAEMASSFLATELGVPQGESLENTASYLRSWLGAMKADSNFIFKASTQASKVSDYLLSFVEKEVEQPEPAIIV